MKTSLLFFLLTLMPLLHEQTRALTNSSDIEFTGQPDTVKVRLCLEKANYYATSATSVALKYISQAREIAARIDCKRCSADILLQEGIVLTYSSDYPGALQKFDKALAAYRQLKIKDKEAWCLLWKGGIDGESLNYATTMDYYTQAMNIFRSLKDKEGMAHCYYMMATVYAFQNDSKTAIEYDRKAIQAANKKDKEKLPRYYLSLFRDYYTEGLYSKALALTDSFIPAFKEANNLYLLGQSHCYIGCLYMELKDYKKAKAYILKAVDYDNKFGNKRSMVITKLNLAQLYMDVNQPDSAIVVLKELVVLNQKFKSLKFADMIYYNLAAAYERKGDYKSAFEYCNQFIAVNDSVIRELTNKRLLEMQTKYEVDIKNEQIKLLEKDKQLAHQRYLIIAIGFILVVFVSLYVISYKHRKAKEKQQRYETEIQEATDKIGVTQRELTLKAMQISQQENNLAFLRDELEKFKKEHPETKEAIQGFLSHINLQLKQNAFNDFEKYFIEVHPEFYNKLKHKYEDLSQNELRVCALLRLNLSSKQIAEITGRSIRSVEGTRTSIRKKMNLTLQDNLYDSISII